MRHDPPQSAAPGSGDGRAPGAALATSRHGPLFHSWAAQAHVRTVTVVRASGSSFWDREGKRYLDFSSQLVNVNIGHAHPRVVAAVQDQAARLCTLGPHLGSEEREQAARLVLEHAPVGPARVFFTNAGAEAVEHAVRMARCATGRPKVLTAYRSYHGATQTALHLTGDPRRWAIDTGAAAVARFFGPYRYRSPFGAATDAEECDRALHHLDQVIRFEGPGTIAAVLLEAVPGTAGILVPPDGYLEGVRRLCDEHGLLLIADEVMAGFGRTGAWFSMDHWGVGPDLLVFAKGVNSGYVPLGGVVVGEPVASAFDERPYPGGLTYSGHPLACAAAVATIEVMRSERVVEHAAWLGERVLGPGLRRLAERHPSVGEVRGRGAFWAVELVRDRERRTMLVPYAAGGTDAAPMQEVASACRERGLWPLVVDNRIHVAPPCTTTEEEAEEGLAILDEALAVADRYTG